MSGTVVVFVVCSNVSCDNKNLFRCVKLCRDPKAVYDGGSAKKSGSSFVFLNFDLKESKSQAESPQESQRQILV